ncbi:MAG: PH domain-containing protein [Candidatus Buchananbacteria bacterium]|nr:PH domain-containing protein [Candidatus Buchananbacteria bacterium]
MIKFFIPHRKDGEKIIFFLRRHPFTIAIKIVFWAIVAIMPLAFHLILEDTVSSLLTNQYIAPIIILFLSLYYLYVWLFMFHSFVDYYLDVWIVTNHRVINIEQKGLFSRTVSEQKMYRIQDVTSELKGLFGTFLDFGTVYIQTAGEQARFIFKQIPQPQEVARKINQLVEENKKYHELEIQKNGREAD